MDYSKTLNLPETSFPVKANPAESELGILNIWEDLNIYERRQRLNKEEPEFAVHSPPMPARDYVCIDDALNMILKDIVVKYKLMSGFNVPYFPTWDCYTSAIEREASQLLEAKNREAKQVGTRHAVSLRKQCRSLCSKYIAFQKKQFQRLGIFAYWDKSVLTSVPNYESRIIEAFGDLYQAGYLHKGAKPTRWCINCQTDLAETEIEYRNYKLLSLYVKFPVIHGLEELGEDVYMVVWTNTPWTLPANTAVTIHPDHDYAAVETGKNEILIMVASAVEDTIGRKARGKYRVVRKMKGLELDKIVYAHPFLDRDSDVLPDRGVSLARGTGCVHATPRSRVAEHEESKIRSSHSATRDPRTRRHEIISAVDQNGQLTEEAGQFCGLNVFECSDLISFELEKRGCLLASEPMEQPYPHCLYCEKPIIVRVADKWLLDLSANDLRQRILKIVDEVNWLPGYNRDRASDTIANRSDWSISRRRIWGVPIPVFYCNRCNTQVDTLESINASKKMINRKGFNQWLAAEPNDILSDDLVCSRCGGRDFHWETDILDPEFISAISHKVIRDIRHKMQDTRRKTHDALSLKSSVLSPESDNSQSADMCLGNDGQNEKWLQSSLLSSIAIDGASPFKSVLIHGPVVDEDGKRISKRKDDAPSIQDLLDEFGADILRFWATSMDGKKHLKMSYSRLELVSKMHRRVRNTCRFLLGNLSGYDPDSDRVDYDHLQEVDRWALHMLAKFIDGITRAFEDCQFHLFYRLLYNFCSVDTFPLYLNIVKYRLYTFPRWSSSRRAVQMVIYEVLTSLTRLMAPILSFTAEEIWRCVPGVKDNYPSVYLSLWPEVNEDFLDDELEFRWNHLLEIRSEIYRSLEKVRQEGKIGNFSQASVTLYPSSPDIYSLLDRYIDDLEWIFMVSKVRLMPSDVPVPDEIRESDSVKGLAIEIRRATGEKCERCWVYSDTVGTNEQYPTLCYRCIAILEGGTYYI